MSISGRFWVSTEASSIVCLDSTREDRWRVFVDLPAKSESLPLELLALAIDDREYEFQDVMAAVGERIGGERLAKNGQIMILTKYPRQLVSLINPLFLFARPRGPEKLQLKPKALGLLTPLVEILHARVFRRQSVRTMTRPVYPPEATLKGGPTFALDSPIRKSCERAGGKLFHRRKRFVLVYYTAGHALLICEQRLVNLRKRSRFDHFRERLRIELIHSIDEPHCIADFAEQTSGITKTIVRFAVDIVAEFLTHKAESGPPLS